MLMGIREYARHRGCSHTAVQKSLLSGRIQLVNGKIDSEAADASWSASTDPAKQRGQSAPVVAPPAAAEIPLVENVPAVDPDSPVADSWERFKSEWPAGLTAPPLPVRDPKTSAVVDMGDFLAAKTAEMQIRAEMAKDKLLRERGQLVDRSEALQMLQSMGQMYASSRENIPSDLARLVLGKTDIVEVEGIIRSFLRSADSSVANQIAARYADRIGSSNNAPLSSGIAG